MSDPNFIDIVIRRFAADDLRALERMRDLPHAAWDGFELPRPSAQTWRQRLDERAGDFHGLVACAAREIVGGVALAIRDRSRRHAGQLGIAVHERWQGRGIGSALLKDALDRADRWLGLRRLEIAVLVDNAHALALCRKFGFEIEGLQRGHSLRGGALVDAYTLARVR